MNFNDHITQQWNEPGKVGYDSALILSESIATGLLVNNPEPVSCITLEGNIIFQNNAAAAIDELKYNMQVFKQADFWKYIARTILKEVLQAKIVTEAGNKIFEFDCRIPETGNCINIFWKNVTAEKAAALQALNAERRLKFATGPTGSLWEYNLQKDKIYYPLKDKSIIGYDERKAPKNLRQLLKVVHPADVELVDDMHKAYLSGKITSHIIEYRIQNTDKSYKWVKSRGELIFKTIDGKPETVVGIIIDISRRKDVEKRSYEAEQRWKLALEGSGNGVWEYNHETKEFYTSDICRQILNIKKNLPTSGWRSLIHPDDVPLLIKINRDYIDGAINSHNIEYRILQPNGIYKWIQDKGTLVSKSDDGSPVKFTGLMCDVSERKHEEEVLKLSEEKYRSIIEDMNLGLLEIDNEYCILYVNQSFCLMSGYSYDELKGKKISDVFFYDQHITDSTKNIGAHEVPVKNKNGENKWWLVSSSLLYDDKQNIKGAIRIHLDITQQKAAEQNLIEARQIAERSVKAKDVFIANMSHEIRTPMNAISGLSNLLKKTSLTPAQQSYLSSVQTATNNLLIIINDLLDLSKIDAGKMVLENIGFELSSLMDEALKYIVYKADEKGLKLLFKGDKNLHRILIGDPYKVNQVLNNLLSNAVKFTNSGSITLLCNVIADEADKQIITIAVKDTGIGMDEAFQEQLFTKFAQEDESITRRYGGSGLGMNITKQLVDLMNGSINIISKKNEGTTVNITLAFLKGAEKDLLKKEQLPDADTNLKNVEILLAEDNDMNRLVAATILQQYGAVVDEAVDGKIAYEKAAQRNYDLILMDIRMPEMDGFEATRLIRENGSRQVPVIALTAHALKHEAEKCLAAGMNDFLVKPYQETDLIRIILKWLNKTNDLNNKGKKRIKKKLYDLTQLKEISNNSKTFMAKMLSLFIESMPANFKKMESALHENNLIDLKNTAHTLKPIVDNMNILSQKEAIRRIEDIAAAGIITPELKLLVKEFKECISEVVENLKTDKLEYE